MIVQQFGGNVNVNSKFGMGSTFEMTLMLSENVQEKEKVQRLFNKRINRRPVIKIVIGSQKKEPLLMIDDDESFSDNLSQIQ